MDPRQTGWIGAIIGNRWRIDSRIARGGVATVFKASERGGPNVAVKIMHPEYSRNLDARGRFLREGYVANKVGHPSVVKVLHDGAEPDGAVYLVMELLEEGELLETKRERLGGKLLPDEVARLGDQLLDVLAAAHEKGIVHRDIKPENLYVLGDGTLKVLDFGIAHIKEGVAKAEPTATGLLLGTPDFMSPEQAQGMRGTIDPQTDVYAVGATLFTLLSGEAVHVETALGTLLHATASKQARSLAATRAKATIPEELIAVVDKALMLQKAQRWASARAMQEGLRKAMPPTRTQALRPIKIPPVAPRVGTASAKPPAPLAPGVKATPVKPPRPALEEPKPPSDRTVMELPRVEEPKPPSDRTVMALPRIEEPKPASDRTVVHGGPLRGLADDPAWTKPFAEGELDGGHTVALADAPPLPAPRAKAPSAVDAQGETQAVDPALLPIPPPPRTPSIAPPPMSLAPNTPPMHQLPQPTNPAYAPPAPRHASMAPPPGHHSMPPPPAPPGQQFNSFPPPAPATPRGGQGYRDLGSGSSPLMPKMIAAEPEKSAKPRSILVAEIILAALVVITLSIGGCLLLRR
ncbi:MAG: protein kinase [Labilithrix sp.]|nr:protein kinase [Labilithrix sp.]MCW5814928.1 protein kinase [Labilithrix sp.]